MWGFLSLVALLPAYMINAEEEEVTAVMLGSEEAFTAMSMATMTL